MLKLIPADDVELIVFDFDGVLTDNHVYVFENGLEAVRCNRADGLGFDLLRQYGMKTLILSTEKNPVVQMRAAKLKVIALSGLTDKVIALREYCEHHAIALSKVIFVGNDINDIAVMRVVGYPMAVADAHPSVKTIACHVLKTNGGAGVVRELIETVLPLSATVGVK
jgi:YrbI family 3-deoxy-D-manno-octulosonate 8-phosphate phosphatase